MTTSLQGIGAQYVTFEIFGTVTDGKICKLKRSRTVCATVEDDDFIGVVDHQKGDYACVQIKGFVRIPYTGSAITVGWKPLAADGTGGVTLAESGRETLVMELDETNHMIGVYL